MYAWPEPPVPVLPGSAPPLRLTDSATHATFAAANGDRVGLYVCGITPYDATHLGHAATYVTFDLVVRALRDSRHEVTYVQNITDVDDPLLERAARDGLDWRDLAAMEIQLFRDDMTALRVIPPTHYLGVVERMARIEAAVATLCANGAAYALPVPASEGQGQDVYLDLTRRDDFGQVSGWTREQMLEVFADRGGDPDRPGKRDRLDPLLWRAARAGEPSWPSAALGAGRPGWHIECTSIALDELGTPFDIQGGGTDLVFPHHEMSAVQAGALTGAPVFARGYVHQAMVGLHGEKMSKSKGNLVLVSRLLADGVDPMAIRLVLLAHHYRSPWDYTDDVLVQAQHRLDTWRQASRNAPTHEATRVLAHVRERLNDDLDTPAALQVVDDWAATAPAEPSQTTGTQSEFDVPMVLDALLGLRLG